MKFVNEFRDPILAQKLVDEIRSIVSSRWTLMDVCGGQTHSLLRYGIEEALADCVELIHGPGCPVCVTPSDAIDFAQRLAMQPGVILASFGDMLRVPGSRESLLDVRARGGRVKIVYSPIDAVQLAKDNPEEQVVFFAVGFETTAPATALAILQAKRLELNNFSVLVSHVRVLPAMEALMLNPESRVEGFLAAGHVCTITGYSDYDAFVDRFRVPVVVTGFEPLDLLQGILEAIRLLEKGIHAVVNCYARSARRDGNPVAQSILDRVYEVADCSWRGFGSIERGGLRLRQEYSAFDATLRFRFGDTNQVHLPELCLSAEVMSGKIKPPQCPFFGNRCTPDNPLGAPMVSSEGACSAYMRYRSATASSATASSDTALSDTALSDTALSDTATRGCAP
ncbi:MAG: hydrogenase formation protein HypD [Pirellula sp.]